MSKTIGEYLVELMNAHIKVVEVDSEGNELYYIITEWRDEDAQDIFFAELMGVVDRCKPNGKVCVVSEGKGFELVDESKVPYREDDQAEPSRRGG